MSSSGQRPAGSSMGRRAVWLFRGAILGCAVVVSIVGCDLILRWRDARIARTDRLDPGMIRFDPELGWSLVPFWTGRHVHYDYSVSYRIGADGFRRGSRDPGVPSDGLTVVAGDSFTFGFGVEDDQTFVDLLDAGSPRGHRYHNAGIPGYSTDQELLMLERHLPGMQASRLVLVVYVGNDLFDNRLGWPLQAGNAKPYFELTAGGRLVPRHTPVPPERKPPDMTPAGLMEAVLGEDASQWPLRHRLGRQSALVRLLVEAWPGEPDFRGAFAERFEPEVRLFGALVHRLADLCRRYDVNLVLAPLAGRSYVEDPDSISAQYQEIFVEQVIACARAGGITCVALAPRMRTRHREAGESWYFPNEGHLNGRGHVVVAEILADALSGGN